MCSPTPPKRVLEGLLEHDGPVAVGHAGSRVHRDRVSGECPKREHGLSGLALVLGCHRAHPGELLFFGAPVGIATLAVVASSDLLAGLEDRGTALVPCGRDALADRIADLLHVPIGNETPAADQIG